MGLNGKSTLPESAAACRKSHGVQLWELGCLWSDIHVRVIKTVAPTFELRCCINRRRKKTGLSAGFSISTGSERCVLQAVEVTLGVQGCHATRAGRFGEHYRSVVATPEGSDHGNIRALIEHGLAGVKFAQQPLTRKS